MCKCQQDLYDNDEWNERRKNGLNSFPATQRTVVAGANNFDESVYGKEAAISSRNVSSISNASGVLVGST